MSSETFYPKWGLFKNTLLHVSETTKERMRSRTLVVTFLITVFASLCCFMNSSAQNYFSENCTEVFYSKLVLFKILVTLTANLQNPLYILFSLSITCPTRTTSLSLSLSLSLYLYICVHMYLICVYVCLYNVYITIYARAYNLTILHNSLTWVAQSP